MTLYVYPPAPGTREYSLPHLQRVGPCKYSCDHTDCERMRRDAVSPCGVCEQPIGYDHAVLPSEDWPEWADLVHATCYRAETSMDRGRMARRYGYERHRQPWLELPGLRALQVAREMRVVRSAVTDWIRNGALKATKVRIGKGKKWEYRITEDDLAAFKRLGHRGYSKQFCVDKLLDSGGKQEHTTHVEAVNSTK